MDSNKLKLRLAEISEVNPALTCYSRDDAAPVLPLREEPDLLSWLENTGRLVTEEANESQEISTIEEEELSALMGEKEDYKGEDEVLNDDWEDIRNFEITERKKNEGIDLTIDTVRKIINKNYKKAQYVCWAFFL